MRTTDDSVLAAHIHKWIKPDVAQYEIKIISYTCRYISKLIFGELHLKWILIQNGMSLLLQ